jgi:hypothetical protein
MKSPTLLLKQEFWEVVCGGRRIVSSRHIICSHHKLFFGIGFREESSTLFYLFQNYASWLFGYLEIWGSQVSEATIVTQTN